MSPRGGDSGVSAGDQGKDGGRASHRIKRRDVGISTGAAINRRGRQGSSNLLGCVSRYGRRRGRGTAITLAVGPQGLGKLPAFRGACPRIDPHQTTCPALDTEEHTQQNRDGRRELRNTLAVVRVGIRKSSKPSPREALLAFSRRPLEWPWNAKGRLQSHAM